MKILNVKEKIVATESKDSRKKEKRVIQVFILGLIPSIEFIFPTLN